MKELTTFAIILSTIFLVLMGLLVVAYLQNLQDKKIS